MIPVRLVREHEQPRLRGLRGLRRVLAGQAILLGFACTDEPPTQRETLADGLRDGSVFVCTTDRTSTLSVDGPMDPTRRSALSRTTIGDQFRVRYGISDVRADDDAAPMKAVNVFQHAIPQFEQVHFPPSVEAPSHTFLRTEPNVFMLFQLDPWEGDVTGFTWVERRDEDSFTAVGRCSLPH